MSLDTNPVNIQAVFLAQTEDGEDSLLAVGGLFYGTTECGERVTHVITRIELSLCIPGLYCDLYGINVFTKPVDAMRVEILGAVEQRSFTAPLHNLDGVQYFLEGVDK